MMRDMLKQLVKSAQAGFPKIGIFWFKGSLEEYKLVDVESCTIKAGYDIGNYVVYPRSHQMVWKEKYDSDDGYRSILRGRVEYNKVDMVYEVRTGFEEIPQLLMDNINNAFCLDSRGKYLYMGQYDWGVNV